MKSHKFALLVVIKNKKDFHKILKYVHFLRDKSEETFPWKQNLTEQRKKEKKKKNNENMMSSKLKIDLPYLIIQQEVVLWTFLDQTRTNYCHWRCVKLV